MIFWPKMKLKIVSLVNDTSWVTFWISKLKWSIWLSRTCTLKDRCRRLQAGSFSCLQSENLELQKIAEKQLHAIEVFKEESAALRSDLAFVGKQTNVTVTPENPSVTAIEIPEFTARSPRTHSLISSISNQKVGALTDGYGASSPAPKFEVSINSFNSSLP